MPLTDQAKFLLEIGYREGAPRFHELTVDQARHSFRKLLHAFRPEAPAVASTTDVPIRRADGTVLLAKYYRPITSAPQDVIGLAIFLHGGGWCVGDVDGYDVVCRQLANASGCAVLSVDYRLAPEHPFPAAPEDARLAYDWAVRHGRGLGIDSRRIALVGDSAGGNLALVLALELRSATVPAPRLVVAIYPCTDIHSERASRLRYADGYFLDRDSLEWFFSRYLPRGGGLEWRASPMRAASVADLPPILMVTAEFDPLTDDCRVFADRVRAEGGRVDELAVAGMLHGFLPLGKLFPESATTFAAIGSVLGDSLAHSERAG